jgi:hypothetical protein
MKKGANILPEQQDASLRAEIDARRCVEGTICCVIDETDRLLNSALIEKDREMR